MDTSITKRSFLLAGVLTTLISVFLAIFLFIGNVSADTTNSTTTPDPTVAKSTNNVSSKSATDAVTQQSNATTQNTSEGTSNSTSKTNVTSSNAVSTADVKGNATPSSSVGTAANNETSSNNSSQEPVSTKSDTSVNTSTSNGGVNTATQNAASKAVLKKAAAVSTQSTVPVNGLDADSATITDANGNTVNHTQDLSAYDGYKVNYSWSINDGTTVKSGDTAPVTLPGNVQFNSAVSFNVTDSAGDVIGTFSADKGAQSGLLTFGSYFENNTIGRAGNLTFNVTGTKTSSDNNSNWLSNKIGWWTNSDMVDGHPASATWNIAFNPSGASLSKVVLTDTIGANQSFNNDIVTQTGSYNADGEITPTSVDVNGQVVTITFENVN